MRKRFIGFILAVLLSWGAIAYAHEHRHVGPYEITFGWRVEPAFAGQSNGPEVFVMLVGEKEGEHSHEGESGDAHEHSEEMHSDESEAQPVTDAELQVEVSFGPQSMTVPLRPAWGEPGRYIADITPTLPGDYTFRVFGTIGDVEIDEVFSSADGQFSTVEPATDVQFPLPQPDLFDLLARIEALEAEIAALKGE